MNKKMKKYIVRTWIMLPNNPMEKSIEELSNHGYVPYGDPLIDAGRLAEKITQVFVLWEEEKE